MKKICFLFIFIGSAFFSSSVAQQVVVYPGAVIDEKATKEAQEAALAAKSANVHSTIYTTQDSFQKVAEFYKTKGKEYQMPMASGSSGKPKKSDLCDGCDLWEAYFIFDGAKNLASSKLWIKVQYPYIGEEIRNITAIIVTEKK